MHGEKRKVSSMKKGIAVVLCFAVMAILLPMCAAETKTSTISPSMLSMGITSPLPANADMLVRVQIEGVVFVKNYSVSDEYGTYYYEIYKCDDAEKAKEFLEKNFVDKYFHYIIVETPIGNWGMDIKGLYKEYIMPWQTDIDSGEVEGSIAEVPDAYSLEMSARGANDNFIVKVKCGNCGRDWTEGLRYQNWTIVQCPNCKALNKINSENFMVIFK
jgi:phage FluMu protein Com